CEVHRGLHRQRPGLQHALQRFTFHVLHHQPDQVAVSYRVVERHDVRMVETRLHLDLTLESPHLFRIVARARRQQLHRLDSTGDDVLDLVHRSHTAGAGDTDHPVVAHCIAYLDRFHTPCIATRTSTINPIKMPTRPIHNAVLPVPPTAM